MKRCNNDAGGYATIKAGKTSVHVDFSKDYPQPPVIVLTPGDNSGAVYHYENVTEKGFDIVMNQQLSQDANLSWLAVSINNAKTIVEQ